MSKTLYLKLARMTEVHKKDVQLKDVAELYSDDSAVLARCGALKIKTIREDEDRRYVESVLTVIQKIAETDPSIQVNNVGETDFIIDYHRSRGSRAVRQWMKALAVAAVSFCGAAFAIMTFNNDASVNDVFAEIYRMVLGQEPGHFSVLEVSYSVGLALGILVFFNHFAVWKLNTDPTPLEVEMRLYEDNVSKTLIQNDGRKESGIDVT